MSLWSDFLTNDQRLIHKWTHYFGISDRHFSRFRGKNEVVLEFGVSHGGSLQMWRDYFGPNVRICGVDIDPRCATYDEWRARYFRKDASAGTTDPMADPDRDGLARVDGLVELDLHVRVADAIDDHLHPRLA